jgi:hypothetical protein
VIAISDTEKDRSFDAIDIVKKYFLRIFTVLSKEVKQNLMELNLTKEELKEVKRELAFLPEEKQLEYLEELKNG